MSSSSEKRRWGALLQMVERHEADLVSRVGKAVKYHVICAFAPQLDRAGRRADDDAHALPVRVEGKRMQQLVDLHSKRKRRIRTANVQERLCLHRRASAHCGKVRLMVWAAVQCALHGGFSSGCMPLPFR